MSPTTIEPVLVHATSRTLTLPEVAAFRDETVPDMLNDAEAWGLVATGPWTFVSHNLPQDTETTFELTICRPIEAGGEYAGEYQIVELPGFLAAVAEYEGPLSGIYADTYAPLLESLLTGDAPLSGEVRELYHVYTEPESPQNRVEIQIGIAMQDEAAEGVIEGDGRVVSGHQN